MAKGVTKPVYFNPENSRELELLVWCDNKFSSFGGLVKDLLYQEMQREKGLINIVEVKNEVFEYKQEVVEESIKEEPLVDLNDVLDVDC